MGKDAIIEAQKQGHLQGPGTVGCVTGSEGLCNRK